MITLYSGTPGAGKSLHVARTIYTRLRTAKRDVIATFPINMDVVTKKGKKKTADFIYRDITDMNTEYLIRYALENHKLGKENQTLVVIDECQIIFNPREFSRADRLKWIVFFTQHRKLGYDFILISQFDRLIDRQIRCLLEYNVVHRKANNLGILWLLPIKFFVAVSVWYGAKVKCGQEFFLYRKKFGKMYDSFMMFDDDFKKYIKESGDKVSDFNRKVLNLDKPDKPKPEQVPDLNDEEADKLVSGEVEKYAEILKDLPGKAGRKEFIELEAKDTIRFVQAYRGGTCDKSECPTCANRVCEAMHSPDITASGAEASAVEAGGRGSLPKQTETQAPPAFVSRLWKLLNTPIRF